MLRTIDLRGRDLSTADLLDAVPRARAARAEALSAAADIVADVRERGEIALREQAARFDGAEGHAIRVPAEHLADALERLDPRVRAALDEAIRRARHYEKLDVAWFEEPIHADDVGGHRRLSQSTTVPIATPTPIVRTAKVR